MDTTKSSQEVNQSINQPCVDYLVSIDLEVNISYFRKIWINIVRVIAKIYKIIKSDFFFIKSMPMVISLILILSKSIWSISIRTFRHWHRLEVHLVLSMSFLIVYVKVYFFIQCPESDSFLFEPFILLWFKSTRRINRRTILSEWITFRIFKSHISSIAKTSVKLICYICMRLYHPNCMLSSSLKKSIFSNYTILMSFRCF